MPIREYQAIESGQSCDYCRAGYEQLETLCAGPATQCPHCGAPVQRLISVPNVGNSISGLDHRARNAGFHKLKRLGRGEYERQY